MKHGLRRLRNLLFVALSAMILALAGSLPAVGQSDEQGGAPGEGVPTDPLTEQGNSGDDGGDSSCTGGACSGKSGSSGTSGDSRRGDSSGGEGQQVTPTPTPTASSTGTGTTAGTSRTTRRTGSSVRPSPTPSIPTILLYPETGTPLPGPTAAVTPALDEEGEAKVEQAANPVEEPARQASSGGFPVRRVIGILAVFVAIGSAWSLVTQGKSKRGRRSMARSGRRL